MKLNVLILCKPQVTSDLYSGKKDPCWSVRVGRRRGGGTALLSEQHILFSLPEV